MNRTNAKNPTGCPYCSGRKIVPDVNDLATTHPDLAVQLVDQSLATTTSKGGTTLVLWQCPVNPEHTWLAAPSNRVKPSGCPMCYRLHTVDRLPEILPDINPLACERLYARKLTVRTVPGDVARRFWRGNHLQGPVNCTVNIGLYDTNGILRALLGVGRKNHGSRVSLPEGTWDIQRYATLGTIVGGFTRLLAHAETLLPVHTWTSWSDNDISDGGMYQAADFTPDKRQAASYSYVGSITRWERVHRSTYTKQRFIDDPDLAYEPGQTEHEAALANRLYRIYDAGKTRWIKHVER